MSAKSHYYSFRQGLGLGLVRVNSFFIDGMCLWRN